MASQTALVHKALVEGLSQGYTTPLIPDHSVGSPLLTPGAGHNTQYASKGRCYDRPGRKPTASPERNPIKLHDRIFRERGGSNFATDWILTTFKYEMSEHVLRRVLMPQEINAMKFIGGFEPRQVYDGFITKVGEQFECGLCKEDKKTYWKAKKNAPRHLRKFHFGFADVCKVWYVP